MNIIKIDGQPIKNPTEIEWTLADLDSAASGRNQAGDLFRDRISTKRKLVCHWGTLTQAEAAALLEAVDAASFELEAPDARTGAQRTGTFYAGDRNAPVLKATSSGAWVWSGLSMDFIEL